MQRATTWLLTATKVKGWVTDSGKTLEVDLKASIYWWTILTCMVTVICFRLLTLVYKLLKKVLVL